MLIPYSKKKDSEHLKIEWTYSQTEDKILIKIVSLKYSEKKFRCLHNTTLIVHTWRKQSMISQLKSDKGKKAMTCNDKEEVEGSFNGKKIGTNPMHTFFYSIVSDFADNLEGMLDEGIQKTIIQNMHKLVWKE